MRFSIASIFFLIGSFIFFICWAVGSLVLSEFYDALSPSAPVESMGIISLLPSAFGIISAIFFVTGLLIVFVLDSLADEPETYWR